MKLKKIQCVGIGKQTGLDSQNDIAQRQPQAPRSYRRTLLPASHLHENRPCPPFRMMTTAA